jgi:hypothetical protein
MGAAGSPWHLNSSENLSLTNHLLENIKSHIAFDYCFRLDQYLPAGVPADGPSLPFCTHTFPLDFSMQTFEHLHVSSYHLSLVAIFLYVMFCLVLI